MNLIMNNRKYPAPSYYYYLYMYPFPPGPFPSNSQGRTGVIKKYALNFFQLIFNQKYFGRFHARKIFFWDFFWIKKDHISFSLFAKRAC